VVHGVRSRVFAGALTGAVLLSGCSDEKPADDPASIPSPAAPVASFDSGLDPAAAVLALVPADAETLTVTDFDQVRAELGMDGLTGHSTPDEVATFWQRADQERPLLSSGMLRTDDAGLAEKYGFTEVDVAWEAHFFDADGRETGWVLAFRDGTDMAQVARAAHDATTPVHGGDVDAAGRLVTSGTTADPADSWAADPELVALVGPAANSTYVARHCLSGASVADVDDLGAYSVQFQGTLVTARLGPGRQDLFTRMRAGQDDPRFSAAYAGGVADPTSGRIGYEMPDPAEAAHLALERRLPFATCPSAS
jgi:hypothetical protein